MTSPAPHSKTVETMLAKVRATEAARPLVDDHDLECARLLMRNALWSINEARRLLDSRPDLTEPLQRVAAQIKVQGIRVVNEKSRGGRVQ